MRVLRAIATMGLVLSARAAAAYDRDSWPSHYAFADGTDISLIGVYRYDTNEFSNDKLPSGKDAFADAHTNRRKELGVTLKKAGVYDAIIDFEYQSRTWLDTFLRLQSRAFLGSDYGALRIGYTKTPVAFEGVTATKADSFLELALPSAAIFEGRRTGIDWAVERPQYVLSLGYYCCKDLLGDNHGRTLGGRVAWTPIKAEGDVLQLGLSGSSEHRDSSVDGRGIEHAPSVRISAPPEAGLTPVRLIDSGSLADADRVDRAGFESLWIDGPWSLQGEFLHESVSRFGGKPDVSVSGAYAFVSWVLTGESRPYASGNTGNIKPKSAWGAWELLLRYSELDVDSGAVLGGKEHDWTLGANWYLTEHFKFQANYIHATSEKGNLSLDPHIFEARIQVHF